MCPPASSRTAGTYTDPYGACRTKHLRQRHLQVYAHPAFRFVLWQQYALPAESCGVRSVHGRVSRARLPTPAPTRASPPSQLARSMSPTSAPSRQPLRVIDPSTVYGIVLHLGCSSSVTNLGSVRPLAPVDPLPLAAVGFRARGAGCPAPNTTVISLLRAIDDGNQHILVHFPPW